MCPANVSKEGVVCSSLDWDFPEFTLRREVFRMWWWCWPQIGLGGVEEGSGREFRKKKNRRKEGSASRQRKANGNFNLTGDGK